MPRPASRLHGKGPTALGRICSCGRLARPPLPLPPLYPTWRSRYPRGETMLLAFFDILQLLLTVLTWIIIIQTILSWLRSEEHTSELQSLMRISYAVFCLKKKNTKMIQYKSTH